jgi:hypothetical protein
MSVFGEELNPLHSFIMPSICMQELLWYKTCMLFLPHIAGRIEPPLPLTPGMKYGGRPVYFATLIFLLSTGAPSFIFFLMFLQAVLAHLLVPLHDLLLLLGELCLLRLELLLSLVDSPGARKLTGGCITRCLTFSL